MNKEVFWRYTFYGSLIVLTIWLILKSLGVFNTPFWLEYGVPIASIIVGFLAMYQNLLQTMAKITANLAVLTTRFDYMDAKVDRIDLKVNHLDKDMHLVKNELSL